MEWLVIGSFILLIVGGLAICILAPDDCLKSDCHTATVYGLNITTGNYGPTLVTTCICIEYKDSGVDR